MSLIDLICIAFLTAITDQDCLCDLLVQQHTHGIVLVANNIEIGDIDNVITMQCILDVDRLRIGCSAHQLDVCAEGLLIALLVSQCIQILSSYVCLTSTDTADRALAGLLHNSSNPAHVSGKLLRCSRVYVLVLRKQSLDLVDTVCQGIFVLLAINADRILQCTDTTILSKLNNRLLISMTKYIILCLIFGVKNVVFHVVVSSF